MQVTILYTALAGAAGFIAALISFLFNTQLESVLKYGSGVITRQVEGNARSLFLGLGLAAFLLLLGAVVVAVIQYWESLLLLIAAGGVIAFAWVQTLRFLGFVNATAAAGALNPPAGAGPPPPGAGPPAAAPPMPGVPVQAGAPPADPAA